MKAAPVLAALLGTFLACLVAVAVVLLFFPQQAQTLRWLMRLGLHPPVVHCATFYTSLSAGKPCPPASGGLIITRDFRPDPLNVPLTNKELGSEGKTVFAEFVGFRGEGRTLFFVIKERGLKVDACFHTDYGDFAGAVKTNLSDAHVHRDELCFDLTVERLDGSGTVERWQGRLARE